jgi:SAM-dependent methyltransferase
MSDPIESQLPGAEEAQSSDPYDGLYALKRQSLHDGIRREVFVDYFGQTSWVSTADYDRFYRWLDLTRDSFVLDVACGSGAPALRLARSVGCAVVGVDRNAHAIADALALASEQGPGEPVRFERHDANQPLPFPESTFDAVLCIDALDHLSDHRRIFEEWARVLKSGGRLLFTAHVITGPLSNVEVAMRASLGSFKLYPSGGHERLLEDTGFDLLRREDISADQAEIARRYCVARATHAEALRAAEGNTVFEKENRFRAVVGQLAGERRLSHIVFLTRKPV